MKLTAKNVRTVIMDCLFREDEPKDNPVIVEGIVVNKFGFHPNRLETHKQDIMDMLLELPDEFQESKGGGGYSFLAACMTREGVNWGQHIDMESLFCLGLAIGKVRYVTPRELWPGLPGGVPYCIVLDGKD